MLHLRPRDHFPEETSVVPELSHAPIDRRAFLGVGGAILGGLGAADAAEPPPLPAGVKAVWDLETAHREKTRTRERVCLNGLWRWQPATALADAVPAERWGYFKVPGFWPGNTSYIQEDCQTLHAHPGWKDVEPRNLTAAWYQREVTVPGGWKGRRIALTADYVNSFAVVYLDGRKAGEVWFPGGEVDLTAACRPGATHMLSLLVVALPLKGVLLSYADTNSAREVKGTADRRGLCGDTWLTGTPDTRITDVKLDASVRKGEFTVDAALGARTWRRRSTRPRRVPSTSSTAPGAAKPTCGPGWSGSSCRPGCCRGRSCSRTCARAERPNWPGTTRSTSSPPGSATAPASPPSTTSK
jgi:hypothetical protein